ncbi:hypothetical protein [Mesorhizobium sp.]|uniref:hypothetical protein n=1 Tax=Mesorhizobium sp. TaxID=1871066 RepID=UPI000FE60BEC|nr:hypothetical protein [Mesorhizobium sp.]RWE44218.1 MAG: hypothetical protein EOS80_19960 [Mesorhizobium sp.]
MNAVEITKKDIGRTVEMSDGTTATIEGWDDSDPTLPVIIRFESCERGWRTINGGVLLPGLPTIAAFAKTKLQLEAGKYYLTRDGRKGFVAGSSPFGSTVDCHQVVGYIDCDTHALGWGKDGFYWANKDEDARDLVAEWVEPKRIKGWVNIYPDVNGNMPSKVIVNNCLHGTKDDADDHAMTGRIACIEIDVLEGQGLEGEAGR